MQIAGIQDLAVHAHVSSHAMPYLHDPCKFDCLHLIPSAECVAVCSICLSMAVWRAQLSPSDLLEKHWSVHQCTRCLFVLGHPALSDSIIDDRPDPDHMDEHATGKAYPAA